MKKINLHILLILLFLSIPIISSPDFDGSFRLFSIPMFQRSFLEMVLLIIFFYLNFFILIPKYFYTKKYFIYSVLVLASYLLVAIMPLNFIDVNRVPNPSFPIPPDFKRNNILFNYFRAFLPFCFSLISSSYLQLNIKKREAEMQKNKAELLNLRYQLQPHFLFNILNNIYSLSITKSDAAPESILKLSNVMRYVVNNKELVTLKDEREYLKDYIALQLIRTDESLDFNFKDEIKNENLKIAPMILVNFVENAFKYGFNAEENSVIDIHLSTSGNELYFSSFNKIVNKNLSKRMTTKIGVKNTLERLQEIYPDKHKISIKQTEDEYFVDLKIQLD